MNMNSGAEGVLRLQHAVVTGGGRGLGAAIARRLAREGANVTVMGRTSADLEGQATALGESFGVRTGAVVCDVSDPVAVQRAFDTATAALGPVTILVNNAGQSEAAPVEEISADAWARVLAANLTGTFYCCQRVLKGMRKAGAGRIVNVASIAGLKGFANVAPYVASKHGVIGLTRSLALETAMQGITVNAVCPGYIENTGMLDVAIANVRTATGGSDADARLRLTRNSPQGRLVTLDEVASTVVWLCAPDASAITGQAIAVAGGEVMR